MNDKWLVGEDTAQVLEDEVSSLRNPGGTQSPGKVPGRWSYPVKSASRPSLVKPPKRVPRRAFSLVDKDPFVDSNPSKRPKIDETGRIKADTQLLRTLQSAKRRLDSPFSTISLHNSFEPAAEENSSVIDSHGHANSAYQENVVRVGPASGSSPDKTNFTPTPVPANNDIEALLKGVDILSKNLAEFRAEIMTWPQKLQDPQQHYKEYFNQLSSELHAKYEERTKKDIQESEIMIKENYAKKIAALNAALKQEQQEKKELIKACDAFLTARGR